MRFIHTERLELEEFVTEIPRYAYESAARCYAYLRDVSPSKDQSVLSTEIKNSEYFLRGWTLQELIAPSDVRFLANDWSAIGSKELWAPEIQEITNIDKSLLRGSSQLSDFSIARRMSWASKRKTTRIEDIAYCLIGIFHVNMPLLYGEGERAFIRLQEEIMKDSADQTIFAWETRETSDRPPTGLLAKSPADFKDSGNIVPFYFSRKDAVPLAVTNRGVKLYLPLYHNLLVKDIPVLECQDTSQSYKSLVGIYLLPSLHGQNQYMQHNIGFNRTTILTKMRCVKVQPIYVMKISVGEGASSLFHEHKLYHYTESRLRKDIAQSGELPKKLIIRFDGGSHGYGASHQSNIEKIHGRLYGTNGSQLCYYRRANANRKDYFKTCMDDGYNRLVDCYNIGDEIFLFGFAAGPNIAQEFAQMLGNIGVCHESNGSFEATWKVYQRWNTYALRANPNEVIAFLGLFDTIVINAGNSVEGRLVPLALEISKSASTICHAVSLDEYEAALQPMLLREKLGDGLRMKGIKQIRFPGSHADIGGLVPLEPGESWSLSHIPLVWMVREATEAGIANEQNTAFTGSLETIFSGDRLKGSLHLASTQGHLHSTVSRKHKIIQKLAQIFLPHAASRKLSFTKPRDLPFYAKVHISAIRRMSMESDHPRPANMIINRIPGRSTTSYSAYKRNHLFSISPGFDGMTGQRYIVVNKAEARSIESV
ncbi:hypothetical protein BBP40_001043 [Aspergillus hancockii]|nr:hypothetical protein BBP40_001043 [Aspergillus hancockii]